jgi:hypothetical protein
MAPRYKTQEEYEAARRRFVWDEEDELIPLNDGEDFAGVTAAELEDAAEEEE